MTWRRAETRSKEGEDEFTARAGHAAVVWGTKIVVVGGHVRDASEDARTDAWVLETKTMEWSRLPLESPANAAPLARGGHSATLVRGAYGAKIIVFGGEDRRGGLLDDVHVVDLQTMRWSTPDSPLPGAAPTPRAGHVAASFGAGAGAVTNVFVFGGVARGLAGEVSGELFVLDTMAMTCASRASRRRRPGAARVRRRRRRRRRLVHHRRRRRGRRTERHRRAQSVRGGRRAGVDERRGGGRGIVARRRGRGGGRRRGGRRVTRLRRVRRRAVLRGRARPETAAGGAAGDDQDEDSLAGEDGSSADQRRRRRVERAIAQSAESRAEPSPTTPPREDARARGGAHEDATRGDPRGVGGERGGDDASARGAGRGTREGFAVRGDVGRDGDGDGGCRRQGDPRGLGVPLGGRPRTQGAPA